MDENSYPDFTFWTTRNDGLATWQDTTGVLRSLWGTKSLEPWFSSKHQHVTAQFLRISQRFCRIFAPWFVMWWNISQALIWTGPNDMHFLFFEVWIDSNESTLWSQKSEAKHHNLNPTRCQHQIQICHIQLESQVSTKKRRSISCKISEDLDFDFLDLKTTGLFPHSGFNHDLKKDMSCFFRLGCW